MRVGVPEPETIDAIIGGFAKLPGEWEVKMSGGEVFAFKGFINQVIPEIVSNTRHQLSVLTNFSAPLNVLRRFCELTRDRLQITSASLHPDTADVDEFVEKAIAYRDYRASYNPHSSFVVNVVLVPGKVSNHYKYREQLQGNHFRYFPQLMKIKGGVYPYPEDERKMIEELCGGSHDPMKVNRAPSYQGLHCEAGVSYFVVDQNGEAYTCRTGKKFSPKTSSTLYGLDGSRTDVEDAYDSGDIDVPLSASLGSFVRGDFKRRERGGICPYPICPCTVPANRGIVRIPENLRVSTGQGIEE